VDTLPKNNIQVPFGYEPPAGDKKGTLIVYDDFADVRPAELAPVYRFAEERGFIRIVFYPIHEETARRMAGGELAPYHQRLRALQEAMEEAEKTVSSPVEAVLDQWEGKRKKYTPVETALDFLTEKHKGPFFVWMPERLAAKWAGFASFPEWIRRLRLVVAPPYGYPLPSRMEEYKSRWEYAR
jgi:hypothetical protein